MLNKIQRYFASIAPFGIWLSIAVLFLAPGYIWLCLSRQSTISKHWNEYIGEIFIIASIVSLLMAWIAAARPRSRRTRIAVIIWLLLNGITLIVGCSLFFG